MVTWHFSPSFCFWFLHFSFIYKMPNWIKMKKIQNRNLDKWQNDTILSDKRANDDTWMPRCKMTNLNIKCPNAHQRTKFAKFQQPDLNFFLSVSLFLLFQIYGFVPFGRKPFDRLTLGRQTFMLRVCKQWVQCF